MRRSQPPLFTRTVYDDDALDSCFAELIHAPVSEQDKIEIGCLIQYFMILKHYGLMELPVDFRKHRQGHGPDFTIITGDGVHGAEMTKVTTADYQVWLKKRLNYRPIRDLSRYSGHEPERRVAERRPGPGGRSVPDHPRMGPAAAQHADPADLGRDHHHRAPRAEGRQP